MRFYGNGRVVYQSQSDEGIIEVVDSGRERALHFGTSPRQSAMDLSHPHALLLTYTHAMMAALLLNPAPKRVMMIGLGGGSLVKFLLHHFPDCHIDVVEYRQDVVEVAQRFFHVPTDESRLNIMLGDGAAHMRHCFMDTDLSYDLIMVDAYDHTGMDSSVSAQGFFDTCAGVLTTEGVFSINLWGSDRADFNTILQRINRSFFDRTMLLPVENKGNIIAVATHYDVKYADLKQLRETAEAWEVQYQINLPKSLQNLIRQNRNFIARLFA
jgi:spermidine synthase